MIHPSSTHPLPHHPPSTPLEVGEMVYKLSGRVDTSRLSGLYKSYHYMSNSEVFNTYMRHSRDNTIAKNNATGELIKISTRLLGYVSSPYICIDDIANVKNYGYKVRWEDYPHQYINFEDEIILVPLKDITILDPEQLAAMFKR